MAKFGNVEFTYNANGLRTSKTANGVTKTYILAGSFILQENIGSNSLKYYYGNGNIIGFSYNGIDYFYRKNTQGDVIGIFTSSGAQVASYAYDAWGNHKIFDANGNEVTSATHIGYINPIRYRGYYYDVETELYYLQQRYYDAEIGRFISQDSIEYINNTQLSGLNVYAYCANNPIMYNDPAGKIAWWVVAIIVVAVVAVDHALAKHAPEGVAVYDDEGKYGFHDQFLYAKGTGPKVDENGVTFVDLDAGIYKGTSKTEIGDVSLTTFGTVEATVEADLSGIPSIEASGVASAYTMSYSNTFSVFGIDINISGNLYYGCIGAGVEADLEEARFKIAPPMLGIGYDFGIDFDW